MANGGGRRMVATTTGVAVMRRLRLSTVVEEMGSDANGLPKL